MVLGIIFLSNGIYRQYNRINIMAAYYPNENNPKLSSWPA